MDISLFMSAARPKWWERMYKSLRGNKVSYEIIACGPNKPKWKLPDNFRFYECHFKPAQCYQAAALQCNGELVGWGTDDSTYLPDSLDKIWEAYKYDQQDYVDQYGNIKKDEKIIYAQQSIEDGKDTRNDHFFFWGCPDTPRMAPLAFMNRQWFHWLGGYDRGFISGQSENDIILRAMEDGGKVKLISDSKIYIHHKEVHRFRWNYTFRSGYNSDRQYLEECWCPEGYGTFNENNLMHGVISPKRLLAFHPFNYDNILTVPCGPQGRWGNT